MRTFHVAMLGVVQLALNACGARSPYGDDDPNCELANATGPNNGGNHYLNGGSVGRGGGFASGGTNSNHGGTYQSVAIGGGAARGGTGGNGAGASNGSGAVVGKGGAGGSGGIVSAGSTSRVGTGGSFGGRTTSMGSLVGGNNSGTAAATNGGAANSANQGGAANSANAGGTTSNPSDGGMGTNGGAAGSPSDGGAANSANAGGAGNSANAGGTTSNPSDGGAAGNPSDGGATNSANAGGAGNSANAGGATSSPSDGGAVSGGAVSTAPGGAGQWLGCVCGQPSCGTCPATVTIDRGSYSIDATETTNAEYGQFIDANVSTTAQPTVCGWNLTYVPNVSWPVVGKDNLPVTWVDWCDAYAYCAWAGKRLCGAIGGGSTPYNSVKDPLVSQWFAACTNNGTNSYPYGSTYDSASCNGAEHGIATYGEPTLQVAGSMTTCEVSGQGIYDMSGNAFEWEDSCSDWTGEDDICRVRGGSYFSDIPSVLACTSASTLYLRNTVRSSVGFRCCKEK